MNVKTVATAAVIGMLAILPARNVLAQDTTKVDVGDGKALVLKPHLGLKGFGRLYDGGNNSGAGAGLGVEPGLDIGKAGIGGSFSFVKGFGTLKVEEGSVWASKPLGKITASAYAYQDLFFQTPKPACGAAASGYGVKGGAEIAPYAGADGFWDVYAQVPRGSFTPGVALVGWGNDGYKGGPKKIQFTLATENTVAGKLKLATETLYGKPFSGGDGNLQFRMTVRYSPF
jgi:hypothetical protein